MADHPIAAARKRAGLTQEQLAEMIGVEQGTVARYESDAIQPPISRMRRIAEALGVPLQELTDRGPPPAAPARTMDAMRAPMNTYTVPLAGDMPRDLPVLGAVLAADLDLAHNGGTPHRIERLELSVSDTIDYVRRPPGLRGNQMAYALYVQGDSMSPRLEQGDLIYVDTRRPPAPGDDVVVQLYAVEGDDQAVVTAMVKRLVRRTSQVVELEQFNPPLRFQLPVGMVHAVHRVVRLAELLGV